MLVKYISEDKIKYFQGWIKENGIIYTNAKAYEKAYNHGYKELLDDVLPEYDVDNEYLSKSYVEENAVVRGVWKINKIDSIPSNM